MNYSNLSSRLRLRGSHETDPATPREETLLSLEPGKRGSCLRVRTAATIARRKLSVFRVAATAAAIIIVSAWAGTASAQLGYDPFASDSGNHSEERWANYSDNTTNGTNLPTTTTVNGVDKTSTTAGMFNFAVAAPSPSGAFLPQVGTRGNIYSFGTVLTLTLSSSYSPPSGTFETVVFSIRIAGNPLNTAGVLLTPSGGTAIAPRFTSLTTTGTGMAAVLQYAFQFDLSGNGGANNFSIALPASDVSVSFGSSQLDATTTTFGALAAVPEPSAIALVALGGLGLGSGMLRRRSVRLHAATIGVWFQFSISDPVPGARQLPRVRD